MPLKDKIYEMMHSKNLFNQKTEVVAETTFRAINSKSLNKETVKQGLQQLIESGEVIVKNGVVHNNAKLLEGTYTRQQNGGGYIVSYENGTPKQYYVPQPLSKNARSGDVVSFLLDKNGDKNPVARISNVVSSSNRKVYGMVEEQNGKLMFLPEGKEFQHGVKLVQNEHAKMAVGKRCYAIITNARKSLKEPVELKIEYQEAIFGRVENPMSCVYAKLDEYGVTPNFSKEIEAEVAFMKPIDEKEVARRRDLRNKKFFTIDPATCKDMDDALNIEPIYKNEKLAGYKLMVAIADVGHYVKPGTALDMEALNRGTSIYPAGMVIPMLPKKISNDLCSLNPYEDKPVMVTEVDIDLEGNITAYDIYEAAINSKYKFSYEQISELYHNDEQALKQFGEFKKETDMLYDFRNILDAQARKRGMIPAEGYDATIVLNEEKTQVIDYRNDNHVDSHDVIAQAMILNNRVVAMVLNQLDISNVLRTHHAPSPRNIERLLTTVSDLGIEIGVKDSEPNPSYIYKQLYKKAENHPLKKVIHSMMIRSMRKADYGTSKEVGHYALALNDYTHFTSPIRRYVDLIEHRLMKDLIAVLKKEAEKGKENIEGKKLSEILPTLSPLTKLRLKDISKEEELYQKAFHLSLCERKANEISSETNGNCMALYMTERVGEIAEGYITKVDKNHVVVTLSSKSDPIHSDIIEVKVPIKQLKHMAGGYYLNENQTAYLTKKKSNTSYKLGSTVQVKIASADPIKREIMGSLDLEKKNEKETNSELTLQPQC